ncbi:MAG: hypothetical protein KJ041_01020, partial [Gammaproteobacteria bacterium]|nr:hypothetical protein [Gammaproteobacteria bacterium]
MTLERKTGSSKTERPRRSARFIGLLLLSLLGLVACSSPPSPQKVHALGEPGIPDHAPFADISCLKCHDRDRPAPVTDTTTGAALIHGGGQDCGQCHTAGGASWRVFSAFSHVPTPGSCLDCHSSARPTAIVNNMAHSYAGVGDCAACHAGGAGVTWTSATYVHEPVPQSCAE